jgi:hypothetical protein
LIVEGTAGGPPPPPTSKTVAISLRLTDGSRNLGFGYLLVFHSRTGKYGRVVLDLNSWVDIATERAKLIAALIHYAGELHFISFALPEAPFKYIDPSFFQTIAAWCRPDEFSVVYPAQEEKIRMETVSARAYFYFSPRAKFPGVASGVQSPQKGRPLVGISSARDSSTIHPIGFRKRKTPV